MATHTRILVADDLDLDSAAGKKRSHSVVQWGAWLAEKTGDQLDLLFVKDLQAYPSELPYIHDNIEKYFGKREQRLRELSESVDVSGLALVVRGSPVQELLKLSRKKDSPEVIVLGTHGRTGPSRVLLGSVSEEVVRHSEVPVMTVGVEAQKKKPNTKKDPRVVLATDLGPNSLRAEAFAISLARRIKAKIILSHCLSDNFALTQSAFADPVIALQMLATLQDDKKANLKALDQKKKEIEKKGVKCEIRMDSTARSADEAILRDARTADLVVMGTHGRNAFASAFLGSTAREVILRSPVPVITVRSRK